MLRLLSLSFAVAVTFALVLQPATSAGEKDKDKKGTAAGVLTSKEKGKFIEVKADGEEKARKYFFLAGGTKKLHEKIDETPVGSRVRVEWTFVERHRVVEFEVLKKAEK